MKFALRAFLHEHGNPALALARLNYFLCDGSSAADECESVVAVAIGLVDIHANEVEFVCAGAEPPVILRPGMEALPAQTNGLPVGAFRDVEYKAFAAPFLQGDTILMATDGVTEARNGKEFLSYEGMVDLAKTEMSGHGTLREQGQSLLDSARRFTNGKFQDDVCILLARYL